MVTFRAPRGTRDLLPPETATWTRLERLAADLAARYGYRRIETPLFELTDVFERGVGAVTDIVEKELFRLASRTEESDSWALRPEPTAGIVRAYIQHGMHTWPQPVKLTETGPMFRYDRPQAGRYRQFWQFDIEAIGDRGPAIDAEIIELGARFYRDAGLDGVEVHLNSIGDAACRPAYVAELTAYYRGHHDALPELERGRLGRNVMRLLDSKDLAMAALNAAAPKITDRLCEPCAEHFEGVRRHLDALGVFYRLEPGLVRGLDYYTRTAFEYYVAGREGQQQAMGGGGRYDGLVELLGGRPTPGIGFGIGLDRLVLALAETDAPVAVEDRPRRVELHRERDHRPHGDGQDDQPEADDEVETALHDPVQPGEHRRPQLEQRHALAGDVLGALRQELRRRRCDPYLDAPAVRLLDEIEQLLFAEIGAADDQLVGMALAQDVRQVRDAAEEGKILDRAAVGEDADRLVLALAETDAPVSAEPAPVAVVVGADPDDTVGRLRVATDLREAGIAARAELGPRKLAKQLEAAARDHAHFAVILGDELVQSEVGLRDLPAGTQKVVPIADLAREIQRAHGAHRHGTGSE